MGSELATEVADGPVDTSQTARSPLRLGANKLPEESLEVGEITLGPGEADPDHRLPGISDDVFDLWF